MRTKLLALSMLALTLGTAGGALARDPTQWPNPQSHDSSLRLDGQTRWYAPRSQAAVDRMYTNSVTPLNIACDSQNTDNVTSPNGSHSTQSDGCD